MIIVQKPRCWQITKVQSRGPPHQHQQHQGTRLGVSRESQHIDIASSWLNKIKDSSSSKEVVCGVVCCGCGMPVTTERNSPLWYFNPARLALLRPTADTQREAICCAITELLWKVRYNCSLISVPDYWYWTVQCGADKQSVLAITGEAPCFDAKSAIFKTDGITEKVKITNNQSLNNRILTAPPLPLNKYRRSGPNRQKAYQPCMYGEREIRFNPNSLNWEHQNLSWLQIKWDRL